MTMQASGNPISIANISTELGKVATVIRSLNDADSRALSARTTAGSPVALSNFYNTLSTISYTFIASTPNASLNIAGIGGYISGVSTVVINVNAGIYLWSNNNTIAGLTLTGGVTGNSVTLVNKGYIIGQGGAGCTQTPSNPGCYVGAAYATVGGPALSISTNITIDNTALGAYIAGGGGGGGGYSSVGVTGGGGAGGGNGGIFYCYNCACSPKTAIGGTVGVAGANGNSGVWCGGYYICGEYNPPVPTYQGGAGGRILPGVGGAAGVYAGGSGGGAGGGGTTSGCYGGGTGGSGNAVGGAAVAYYATSGGGGGWGAAGGIGYDVGAAAGGKAVASNGKTVTWVSGNTTRVYGVVG